jgi:uncharacterized membrane protein YeiH
MLLMTSKGITRVANLSGIFVFAVEGGLTGVLVGLDPAGVLALAFLTALGGGLLRNVLIGSLPPAAVKDWHYSLTVLIAAATVWVLSTTLLSVPAGLMVALDAVGLSLTAITGTEKALDHGLHPFVALFLGTVSGVGGGTMRDVLINQVPSSAHRHLRRGGVDRGARDHSGTKARSIATDYGDNCRTGLLLL